MIFKKSKTIIETLTEIVKLLLADKKCDSEVINDKSKCICYLIPIPFGLSQLVDRIHDPNCPEHGTGKSKLDSNERNGGKNA